MGENLSNLSWTAGVITTLAFFEVVRDLESALMLLEQRQAQQKQAIPTPVKEKKDDSTGKTQAPDGGGGQAPEAGGSDNEAPVQK